MLKISKLIERVDFEQIQQFIKIHLTTSFVGIQVKAFESDLEFRVFKNPVDHVDKVL
ncbi:hypothetical protein SDC9_177899 [bioreactor metagenome]|uniref:Uncharacterized protein n=1 Tax=bioreactor metagenome TaxID=1076179 RepID=A0A645GUB0_9ZZZZ